MSDTVEVCVDCEKDLSEVGFTDVFKCDLCQSPLCEDCATMVFERHSLVDNILCKECKADTEETTNLGR